MWTIARSLAFALVLGWFLAMPADAAPKWCEDDPQITVNGRVAHVTVGFSADNMPHLTGPISYYVVVAQSYLATTSVDASMATLPTYAYVYALTDEEMKTWKGDKVKVIVFAHVPAKKSFATVTTVTNFYQVTLEREHGRSNNWIEVDFNLE